MIDWSMSHDDRNEKNKITEDQVRKRFEELYGVTIEEVIGALEQRLEENHDLLKKMEKAGFTEEERSSMQDIQNYVDNRRDS
jgi:predicted metalloprotease